MTIRNAGLAGIIAVALAGCSASYGAPEKNAQAVSTVATTQAIAVQLVAPPERDPSELQVLFWNDAQRSERFRDMENWFAGHEVPAALETRDLPAGAPLSADIQAEIKTLIEETNTAGVMVLQGGKVRFEGYGLGLEAQDRWTSFSVAKSFTSTLLGAAVKDGSIESMDDQVTRYIPELTGSAYDDVTVEQIATMTSGVAWNEDYTDPESDVSQLNKYVVEYGPDAIVEQMKRLDREAEPGEKFKYKTGETNLIGLLVENAVGMSLAEYSQAKIVEPAGFAGGMFWMTDPRGGNIGGCCLSLRLSDYARMGEFVRTGGLQSNGTSIVPEGWFAKAGGQQVDFGGNGFGYGYQWWTYPGGNFGAQGIFGQAITLIPEADLVVARVSNWPTATSSEYGEKWLRFAYKLSTQP
ncbi:serine hydrolase domain-containing protein [Erythrobacter crassostreae]|uniref:Serine hydrolase n=1 Tax=Erythrobacter crassostreae TaxID=2828328 RepID=A0A9X1F692_9SPHN|nr:serine hydrolase [Erythrobacter crassostrea]MBV7260058.1 serine hydrolase [Erythrobacter crassostrea]